MFQKLIISQCCKLIKHSSIYSVPHWNWKLSGRVGKLIQDYKANPVVFPFLVNQYNSILCNGNKADIAWLKSYSVFNLDTILLHKCVRFKRHRPINADLPVGLGGDGGPVDLALVLAVVHSTKGQLTALLFIPSRNNTSQLSSHLTLLGKLYLQALWKIYGIWHMLEATRWFSWSTWRGRKRRCWPAAGSDWSCCPWRGSLLRLRCLGRTGRGFHQTWRPQSSDLARLC